MGERTSAESGAATALVLAGGGSRRFGSDKLGADLGGVSVLDHLLLSLPPDWPVVCVGESRPVCRSVAWVREDPPGGGPLAAISAGLAVVTTDVVVVAGGDMPFAGAAATQLARQLARQLADQSSAEQPVSALTARLPDGRAQPLLTAYVTQFVRAAVPVDPAGGRARLLLDRVPHEVVEVDTLALLDVDTPDALAAATRALRRFTPERIGGKTSP